MAFDMMSSSYVYGANTSYNAGNTTYTLSTSTVLETIWDGGGTDTLDGSGISGENIILDLTLMPENPSSQWFNGANITSTSNTLIGGAFLTANDVTSFQAVTIENAIAGSGDDILIGNAAANELTGGAGSDTLTGGSGNDIFVFNSLSGSDTISDWNTANDTLQFSSAVFDASGVSNVTIGSAINADDLLTGVSITNASSSGQTFLFDTDSATLYYDADGVAGGAVVVADLGSSITIDQTDIVMIA
jgi:Ca2+-binding RTX toxin-like protein